MTDEEDVQENVHPTEAPFEVHMPPRCQAQYLAEIGIGPTLPTVRGKRTGHHVSPTATGQNTRTTEPSVFATEALQLIEVERTRSLVQPPTDLLAPSADGQVADGLVLCPLHHLCHPFLPVLATRIATQA